MLHACACALAVVGAGLDSVEDCGQLVAQEDGDDGRRRFVGAQAVVVARGWRRRCAADPAYSSTALMTAQRKSRNCAFSCGLAGLEQIVAGVGGERPVVVLAGAVDAREGLFMQQADQAVACGNLLHHLHDELVVVGGDVGGREDRRQLMLGRGDLVVLGLGEDAELPELFVQILHERRRRGA